MNDLPIRAAALLAAPASGVWIGSTLIDEACYTAQNISTYSTSGVLLTEIGWHCRPRDSKSTLKRYYILLFDLGVLNLRRRRYYYTSIDHPVTPVRGSSQRNPLLLDSRYHIPSSIYPSILSYMYPFKLIYWNRTPSVSITIRFVRRRARQLSS